MEPAFIIEIIGVAIGLIYLYLEYKASFGLWTAGIVMSLFYIVIFFQAKFYADAGIYAYYLIANIYGLIHWHRHRQKNVDHTNEISDTLPITHISLRKLGFSILIAVICWAGLWFLLSHVTDSPVPVGDAFTTAVSIVAMYMLAHKNIEHWWLWVVVNLVSCILYAWKGLYPMAGLFVVYTIVSVMGYFRWRREMDKILIRHSRPSDIETLLSMYSHSKSIMRASGNMLQWAGNYPSRQDIQNDMEKNVGFVMEQNGQLVGTFAFIIGEDPTYAQIYEGSWPENSGTYGTIHRIAKSPNHQHILSECIRWCFTQIDCVRVDTHADNLIMQHLLEKEGFSYCGIIYVSDGTPRKAYQKKI